MQDDILAVTEERCVLLREENARLRERIAQLEAAMLKAIEGLDQLQSRPCSASSPSR